MPVLRCLTSLTFFRHYVMLYLSYFFQKTCLASMFFLRNKCFGISLVRQISFPIHFISVAHCCPLVLIEYILIITVQKMLYFITDYMKSQTLGSFILRHGAVLPFLDMRPHDTIHPLNVANIRNIDLLPTTPLNIF